MKKIRKNMTAEAEREIRVRAMAHKLWEEEGRPEGCAEIHWMKACQLIELKEAAKPVTKFTSHERPNYIKQDTSTGQIFPKNAA